MNSGMEKSDKFRRLIHFTKSWHVQAEPHGLCTELPQLKATGLLSEWTAPVVGVGEVYFSEC